MTDQFDPREYISQYHEDQQIQRTVQLIRRTGRSSEPPNAQLLNLATELYLNSSQTSGYRDFSQRMFSRGADVQLQDDWIKQKDALLSKELEGLQTALGQAQNALDKDKIREALFGLAEFYFKRGDLQNAMKSLLRSRDTCNSPVSLLGMCEKAIRFNATYGNFSIVGQYVMKADQTLSGAAVGSIGSDKEEEDYHIFFRVAQAVTQLDKKLYRTCAQTLTRLRRKHDVPIQSMDSCRRLCLPGDVILMAALCALATFERPDLRNFLENPDVKIQLETEPVVRTMITAFYDCQYATALEALDQLGPKIRRDFYLHDHAGFLMQSIRNSALKQYVFPFATLQLKPMAEAFNTDFAQLEKELGRLITRGTINARIDKAHGILYANRANEREQTFVKVIEVGESFVTETEDIIRNLSLQRNNVQIKPRMSHAAGSGGKMLREHH